MSFSAFLMDTNQHCSVAIGINAYSEEWDHLHKNLTSKGDHVIAGDFKNFDGSQIPKLQEFVLDIINDWYNDGEENALIRRTLWKEISNSYHICGNILYYWNQGMPSGNVMTTTLNSVYNNLLFRASWIDLNPLRAGGATTFKDHVYIVTYGDDNVVNVSDEAIGYFNQATLIRNLVKYNAVYTDENKNIVGVKPFRHIKDINFLKRQFRHSPYVNRIVAPLELDTILEMVDWTSKGMNGIEISFSKVEVALQELSLHPERDFIIYAPYIIDACRKKLGRNPTLTEQHSLHLSCCAKDMYF